MITHDYDTNAGNPANLNAATATGTRERPIWVKRPMSYVRARVVTIYTYFCEVRGGRV